MGRLLALCCLLSLGCSRPPEPAPVRVAEPAATATPARVAEPAATATPAARPSREETVQEPAPAAANVADGPQVPNGSAETGPAGDSEMAEILALTPEHSTSLGSPNHGTLRGGVALPDAGPGFRFNPRRPQDARYGTVELVQAIVRAAAVVDAEMPGSELVINDLSLPAGGPIAQHGSHQNGRDADILFYSRDADGVPMAAVGVPVEPDGSGWDFKDLADPEDDVRLWLDAPRTWRFVRALLEEGGDHVQRIFIVEHVRAMLLEEALRTKAPAAIRQRFEQITCQPGPPHDDHMHVRFHCSPSDMTQGCKDRAPVYPWRRDALSALGMEPAMESWRDRRAGRLARAGLTTSRGEARKKAKRKYGHLHADVRDFLARREGWAKQPHPGRPFCK